MMWGRGLVNCRNVAWVFWWFGLAAFSTTLLSSSDTDCAGEYVIELLQRREMTMGQVQDKVTVVTVND